ncbi:hypothetical protein Nepgr_025189 [Nepenthes gracilis]|uniref:Uncharacterized protein n=1 Tax=Nepenthes gracilis TaxID=150966 RepID=A0AAD3T7A9_NEPGR|nr:hypothetical protein Nepgr_025189 [Nepenthes gracilis]
MYTERATLHVASGRFDSDGRKSRHLTSVLKDEVVCLQQEKIKKKDDEQRLLLIKQGIKGNREPSDEQHLLLIKQGIKGNREPSVSYFQCLLGFPSIRQPATMAFRALGNTSTARAGISSLIGRSYGAATGPKMKAYAPTVEGLGSEVEQTRPPPRKLKGDYVPVFVAMGMIGLSVTLGLHTAEQQLRRAPDVRVKKSKRKTLPELEEPEAVAAQSENFLKKSFFRKVAHVQEFKTPVTDSVGGRVDALAGRPSVVDLRSVGVDPKHH